MGRYSALLVALVLLVTACGSDDASVSSSDQTSGASASGDVVSPQPSGQAFASVDGMEYTFTEPGALTCTITNEAITFSFRIGDNEVTLGGGANFYGDDGWLGNVTLRVANPQGEDGPVGYFPDLAANSGAVAIDGSSMSYSGPMQKQPANDGSNPLPVDIGDGVISATC